MEVRVRLKSTSFQQYNGEINRRNYNREIERKGEKSRQY